MADGIVMEIDIECSCHSYASRLFLTCRRRQSDPDAKRIQDCEDFADLTRFLAVFEIDDEPCARSASQGEILLRHPQAFAGRPDQLAYL
jgi:hypothetical protein